MDPAKRTVLKVTMEDAVKTDEMFTVLMGDQVQPRRDLAADAFDVEAALLADEQTAFEESDRGDVYVGAPVFELDEGAVLGREPLVVPHLTA